MTPEAVRDVYYEAAKHRDWYKAPTRPTQIELNMHCWQAVVDFISKHWEVENERLRGENRDLKAMMADMMQTQAQMPAEVMKALAERA